MMEALRLFPPLIMLLRLAKAPFAVTTSQGKTHVIRKVQSPGRTLRATSLTRGPAVKCKASLASRSCLLGIRREHALHSGPSASASLRSSARPLSCPESCAQP